MPLWKIIKRKGKQQEKKKDGTVKHPESTE